MQIIKILFITSLITLTQSLWANEARELSSLEQDLNFYSGSYQLKQGVADVCPDGEFSYFNQGFMVGAAFRVENINKGLKVGSKPQGACTTQTEANFDGAVLEYFRIETCNQGTSSETTYQFEFYRQADTKYIKMIYQNVYEIKRGKEVGSKNTCLYAAELK